MKPVTLNEKTLGKLAAMVAEQLRGKNPGPTILTPRKSSRDREDDGISLNSLSRHVYERAGLDFDPADNYARDWQGEPDIVVNANGQDPGVIYAVNSDLLVQGTYSTPLTTYATGWRENSDLKKILDFIAPEIPVAKRFEYAQWVNAEMLLSDDSLDDLRGLEGDVTTVQYTSTKVLARTQTRALRLVIDLDEVDEEPGWRENRVSLLTDRLDRNRYRRAISLLSAGATNVAKTWQAQANTVSLTAVTGSNGTASLAVNSTTGLYPGLVIAGVSIPANTVITSITDGTHLTISANITADISTGTAVVLVPANPDGDVRSELRTLGDSSGMRPNRVLYGRTAHDARLTTHETTNSAAGFGAVARDLNALASYLGVDEVRVDEARYQSTLTAKTQIVNNLVLMFMGQQTPSRLDPSNLKTFISPSQGGGYLRVFERQISDQMVEIIVSRRELLSVVTTLGLGQFTVTGG
jgi:hypothetical protein